MHCASQGLACIGVCLRVSVGFIQAAARHVGQPHFLHIRNVDGCHDGAKYGDTKAPAKFVGHTFDRASHACTVFSHIAHDQGAGCREAGANADAAQGEDQHLRPDIGIPQEHVARDAQRSHAQSRNNHPHATHPANQGPCQWACEERPQRNRQHKGPGL